MIINNNCFYFVVNLKKQIIMNQKPTSVKVIYWMTNVLFWIFAIASMFGIIFSGALIIGLLNETSLNVVMPVAMDVGEVGLLEYNGKSIGVEFVEMYGKIHFIDAPREVARIFGVFMLIVLGMALYIFMTFKEFITNVYHGAYFDRSNIMLLKRISYALIAVWIFSVFYAMFQKFYFIKHLTFETVNITNEYQTFNGVLITALLLWVLSHIFQKGVELERENELTI